MGNLKVKMKFAAVMLIAGIQAADKCTWTENNYTEKTCATKDATTASTTHTDLAVDTCKKVGTASIKVTKCEADKVTISNFSDEKCATALTDTYKSVVLTKDCVAFSASKWVKTTPSPPQRALRTPRLDLPLLPSPFTLTCPER